MTLVLHHMLNWALEQKINLPQAFDDLRALYEQLDARNANNTQNLNLPCARGCSQCCYESVFLTPLEFLYVWHYVETHFSAEHIEHIIQKNVTLYKRHRDVIEACNQAPPEGYSDHYALVKNMKYACPFLGEHQECHVYPVRELYARLFGCSFHDDLTIYGCSLVQEHLFEKTVTLTSVHSWRKKVEQLPLTGYRQVYPYYVFMLTQNLDHFLVSLLL